MKSLLIPLPGSLRRRLDEDEALEGDRRVGSQLRTGVPRENGDGNRCAKCFCHSSVLVGQGVPDNERLHLSRRFAPRR